MRRLSAVAVVLFLVALASLGGAAPASASTGVAASVPATDPLPDINPKAGSAKQFMLNVSGKVLGKAMPDSWRREQISYQNRFNHSWDKLELQTGIKSAAPAGQLITENWATKPQTQADYNLRRMEQGLTGGADGKKMKVPSTAGSKFVKSVGGVATAYTGYTLGVMAGNGFMSMIGFDSKGAVCGNTGDDPTGKMLQILTGQDCTGFGLDDEYVPNVDASGGAWSLAKFCHPTYTTECFEIYTFNMHADGKTVLYCAQFTNSNREVEVQWSNGGVRKISTVPNFHGTQYCAMTTPANKNFFYVNGTQISGAAPGEADRITGARFIGSGTGFTAPTIATMDPERTLECSVLGTNGQTYKATSAAFKESTGEMAPPQCPALPDGVAPQNVTIAQKADPAKGVPAATLANQPSTPEFLDFWNSYPECRTGACKLDLLQKPALTSCFDAETACVDWFADGSKTTKYQCRYGTHDVALEECNAYSGVFKKERLAVGAPYSDPLTGEWSGGQSAPAPDKAAMGQPIQSPLVARGCDGMNVTGFDPVGFVMRPIQCALEWAFVPRPLPVQASFIASSNEWKTTAPGIVGDTVAGWNLAAAPAGCGGMPIDLWGVQTTFLDACPGTTLAPVASASHLMSGLVFTIGGVLAIVAIVASVIGYRGLTVAGGNH